MTTWAIGDIQGCYDGLARLLDALRFDPAADHLWFVGDLVNRGGQSLEVLRLVHGLRGRVTAVLGNHDLHLLRRSLAPEPESANPELDRVLAADDAPELLAWLRALPLLHVEPARGVALVHAGIHPAWSLPEAEARARAAEVGLRNARDPETFARLWGAPGADGGVTDLRFSIAAFTRMRFVRQDGSLELGENGPPAAAPAGAAPWFAWPGRAGLPVRVLFGHWSALGFYAGEGVVALDTGFVWGGCLTAVDVDEPGRRIATGAPAGTD